MNTHSIGDCCSLMMAVSLSHSESVGRLLDTRGSCPLLRRISCVSVVGIRLWSDWHRIAVSQPAAA